MLRAPLVIAWGRGRGAAEPRWVATHGHGSCDAPDDTLAMGGSNDKGTYDVCPSCETEEIHREHRSLERELLALFR